jgi:hypothetical protein
MAKDVDMSMVTDHDLVANLCLMMYQNRVHLAWYREATRRGLIQPGMSREEVAWELAKIPMEERNYE